MVFLMFVIIVFSSLMWIKWTKIRMVLVMSVIFFFLDRTWSSYCLLWKEVWMWEVIRILGRVWTLVFFRIWGLVLIWGVAVILLV